MVRPILLVVLCGGFSGPILRAAEPPMPPTGEVRLGSGRVVDYTIHFDRNSLRDSVRLGDKLIALTTSGALLGFELPGVRLVQERIDVGEVTCLGRGEGAAILAGLGDGRVCRVDPATLRVTELTRLNAPPRWVGWGRAAKNRPAGLVVVTRPTKPVDRDGQHWDAPYSVVHDLATGKTFAMEEESTAFLLDGSGRIWLGADRGEWGGRITRVDLTEGTVAAIKPPPSHEPDREAFWEGVYGFVELRDGQVWAFGGTSHMGLNSGYITRIDGAEPRPLSSFETFPDPEKKPDPDRPRLPITHVVEDGGLLVFSYSDVFRVDKELKTWKAFTTLAIQYRWGRPDAVGSYPSVCAVHPPTRGGEPYVLATVADGYVLLEGTKATSHGLPGQLGVAGVSRVENTAEGTLFFESDDRLLPWTLGAKGWNSVSFAPPFEIDPDNNDAAELEKGEEDWYETSVLVGPGGAIYTVSGTGVSAGTRTTGHWVGGKPIKLGREVSSLDPSSSFITADGTLWNASLGDLKTFTKGMWESVASFGEERHIHRLAPLNTNGPPWLLLGGYDGNLWRLIHDAAANKPRLARDRITEAGKPLRTEDAIPWIENSLLLATDKGLRVYSPNTGKLSRADIPEPPHPATTIVRDGLGRLWMGGRTSWNRRTSLQGLWLGEPGAKTPEAFDHVPWIGRSHVYAIAPDPQHADGVVVALGPRGVVFVQARPARP